MLLRLIQVGIPTLRADPLPPILLQDGESHTVLPILQQGNRFKANLKMWLTFCILETSEVMGVGTGLPRRCALSNARKGTG